MVRLPLQSLYSSFHYQHMESLHNPVYRCLGLGRSEVYLSAFDVPALTLGVRPPHTFLSSLAISAIVTAS